MPNDSAWSGVRPDRPPAKASYRVRSELFPFMSSRFQAEDVINEAMQNVRLGYRPHQ
jgi:hypothetical protein